jgi:hypothetical protein
LLDSFSIIVANGPQIGTVADFKGKIFLESTSRVGANIYLTYSNLRYCAYLLLATGRSSVCAVGRQGMLFSKFRHWRRYPARAGQVMRLANMLGCEGLGFICLFFKFR